MCGIAGIIDHVSLDLDQVAHRLRDVLNVQRHRGPDSSGILLDTKVALAHNRLSIQDLTDAGSQPMWSQSRKSVIAYNGEVYNFKDLAETYEIDLRSRSDTEVVLEAFEKVGPKIFSELNGMFAFAIHDLARGVVWLVRDRLGVKPLYLSKIGTSVAFSSEIKGLFTLLPELERRLNVSALHEWSYFGNSLGERTMFEGVVQLEPGYCLRVDPETGGIQDRRYWSIGAALDNHSGRSRMCSADTAAARSLELLDASVKRQLISDVPVGIFLSGGLDSTSIACLAARHSSQTLTTYSASFDYAEDNSELELAAEVAKHCGSSHHEMRIEGAQSADTLRKMVASHDLPFSDAANIPLFMMSEQISSSNKVILQGDGGDEMFGGYQRHLTLMKYGKFRSFFKALQALAHLPISGKRYKRAARILSALGAEDDAKAMALFLTVERESQSPAQIFGQALRERIAGDDPFERYREVEAEFVDRPIDEKMLLVDKSIILPDIFFQKVDRSTMAASVEVRVPFIDNDLLDYVLGLSPEVLMHNGQQKGLLRKAMADVLPTSVLTAKKKGFGVPFGYWVTGAFAEQFHDLIATVGSKHPGLFDQDQIQRRWDEHKSGKADHSFLFWKILNLSLWCNEYDVAI